MLLALLLVAQGWGSQPRPQHGVADYLMVAAVYASANHVSALREIQQWRPPEIDSAVLALRRRGERLRAVATAPQDIAFGVVEAAVLMHAQAGLLALQALSKDEAEVHLRASTDLLEWSRQQAARARNLARMRRLVDEEHGRPTLRPPIVERIDRLDFYQSLAAAALAIGFPDTAQPFARRARQEGPLRAEVHLVFGCVAESLAEEKILRRRESEAASLRDEADRAFRDALALDPGLLEARLHLGRLLVVTARLVEAEPLLEEVERGPGDERQRYLARLFLGRVAERRGRPDEAARFYARALELWPDSQAARFALAHALETGHGPAAAGPVVGASLAASRRVDRAQDPWWPYLFGPPGIANAAMTRVWKQVLGR